MSQQLQPQEQNQANMVQALWFQTLINVIVGIGLVAYFVAKVLAMGSEVFKELKKD